MEQNCKHKVNKKLKVSAEQRYTAIPLASLKCKEIINRMHKSYMNSPYGDLSHLFFFTVVPKGKNKKFNWYIEEFKEACWDLKAINFVYYTRQRTNTNHLHGVISCKSARYKFLKLNRSDKYTFRLNEKVKSLTACTKYMCGERPKSLHFLRKIAMHTNVMYDCYENQMVDSPDKHLVTKEIFNRIKI